jgi:hypothetical protein
MVSHEILNVRSGFGLCHLVSQTGNGYASDRREKDTRELERLENVWNEAHERGDADALEGLWSEDLEVDVPRMPVMNKADVLNFARSGRMKFLH